MSVSEEFEEGAFLGIRGCRTSFAADIAVLSIPYELTTSYGQGTENGPAAAISASAQVELYDELLTNELPCGAKIFTAPPWDGEGDNLKEQQKGISTYVGSNVEGGAFPIIFGCSKFTLCTMSPLFKIIFGINLCFNILSPNIIYKVF